MNEIYYNIKLNNNNLDKTIIPDIGNFIVLIYFAKRSINCRTFDSIIEDFITRQMHWIFNDKTTLEQNEKELMEIFLNDGNLKKLYKNFVDFRGYKDKFEDLVWEMYYEDKLMVFNALTAISRKILVDWAFNKNLGNKLFLITCLSAKRFINPNSIKCLEDNYGVLNEIELEEFISSLNEKKNTVISYYKLLEEIGFPSFFMNDNEDVFNRFMICLIKSGYKKYCRIIVKSEMKEKYFHMYDNLKRYANPTKFSTMGYKEYKEPKDLAIEIDKYLNITDKTEPKMERDNIDIDSKSTESAEKEDNEIKESFISITPEIKNEVINNKIKVKNIQKEPQKLKEPKKNFTVKPNTSLKDLFDF